MESHAITVANGVDLVKAYYTEYDPKHKVLTLHAKKLFMEFMQDKHGVGPLGRAPEYKVTLFRLTRVTAGVSVAPGGIAKVRLGLSPQAIEKRVNFVYMGFEVVA